MSAGPAPGPFGRGVPIIAVAPLVVAAALIGLIAGAQSGSDAPLAASTPAPPIALTGGGAELAVPGGWSRTADAGVPGLPFRHPLALRRRSDGLRVTTELLPARTRTLLPAALAPGAPVVVRLASGHRAWRYGFVRAGASPAEESMLVVWTVPTARGVATTACLSAKEPSAPAACESIARSLVTPGAALLPPGPSAAFWTRVRAVVATLNAARLRGRRALAAAAHARGQTQAARALAAAHRSAGATLAPLTTPGDGAPAQAAQALANVAAAYDGLARATRARRPAGYRRARHTVWVAERRLAIALRRVRAGARAAFAQAAGDASTTQ